MVLMGSDQLGSVVGAIKAKVIGSLRKKNKKNSKKSESYARMEKSASTNVEMSSARARQLIARTLKAADRPGKICLPS